MLPLTHSPDDFSRLHDEPSRCLRVFPPPLPPAGSALEASSSAVTWSCTLYEDDGLSPVQPTLQQQQEQEHTAAAASNTPGSGGSCTPGQPSSSECGSSSYTVLRFEMAASAAEVAVTLVGCEGGYVLPYQEVIVCLPAADRRRLVLGVAASAAAAAVQGLKLRPGTFRLHGL